MFPASPKVEKGKDEDPDQIDKMPVKAHGLDNLVTSSPAGEKARRSDVEISPPNLPRYNDEEDDADRHMRAMEARDHEESRAELGCAPRVAPGSDALQDQLAPFEGLHADERGAQGRRQQHH